MWVSAPIAFKLTTNGFDAMMMSAILQESFDYGVNERCEDIGMMTPLQAAVAVLDDEELPVIRHLLAEGADVHSIVDPAQARFAGGTAMHIVAARGNRAAMLELLIEFGADVAARTDAGAIPLHFAAEGDDHEIVEVLLERGSDVTALDERRWTPLHYAASEGTREEIIITLVDIGGADLEATTSSGQTAYDLILETPS